MDLQLFPHIEFRLSLRDNSDFHSLKYKVESHSGLNQSRVLISFDDGSFQNHIFFAAAYLASTWLQVFQFRWVFRAPWLAIWWWAVFWWQLKKMLRAAQLPFFRRHISSLLWCCWWRWQWRCCQRRWCWRRPLPLSRWHLSPLLSSLGNFPSLPTFAELHCIWIQCTVITVIIIINLNCSPLNYNSKDTAQLDDKTAVYNVCDLYCIVCAM